MFGHVESGGLLEQLGITGGAGVTVAPAPQPFNVDQDRYDGDAFRQIHRASEAMRNLIRKAAEAEKGMDSWPDLVRDIWATYYKPDPALVPEAQVDAGGRVNRPFVQRLLDSAEVQQTRAYTMLDETGAALAALETAQALWEEYQQRPDLQDAVQQARQAAEEGGEGQPGGEGAGQQPDGPGSDQVQRPLAQVARQVRLAVKAAAERGQQKAEDYQAALRGWGLEPGDLQTVPMEQRLQLVQRLMTPGLRRLADLVGRARNLARARQRAKLKKNPDQVVGVESGADLARLLASEYASLRHPVLRRDFYRNFADGSLLQYRLDSKERAGRGPLIAAFDISASMQGAPLDFAICTVMGLVDTAARQKRQAAAMAFDTKVRKRWEWAPGEKDVERLVDLASTGVAGGTDYRDAMQQALAMIEDSRYNRADLVMVTDGLCEVPDDFLARFNAGKRAKGFRVWVALITNDAKRPVRLRTLMNEDPTGAAARRVFGQLTEWADDGWALPTSAATAGAESADDFMGDIFEEVF